MKFLRRPMGEYGTNCYIADMPNGQIIIDPGVGAVRWVSENAPKPLAILNTHGHFDHVWSNAQLQQSLKVPLFCPADDAFFLTSDNFGMNVPPSKPDVLVKPDETVDIGGVKATFHHFGGHTPGCSAIEIGGWLFSGDFIFEGSIGRTDFPYSSSEEMIKSLKKLADWKRDLIVLPGHGGATSVKAEQRNVPTWLEYLS